MQIDRERFEKNMKSKILIVDDSELNRELLRDILQEDYEIEIAEDGEAAVKKLAGMKEEISVMLLDLLMPKVDGFQVLSAMQKNRLTEKIPVLVISGETSAEAEKRCLEMGASDFIRKPLDAVTVKQRIKNILELFEYKRKLEQKVQEQTQLIRKQHQLLQYQVEKLKESNIRIIDALGMLVEFRNTESGQHIKRVKAFTEILARQLMTDYPEYELNEARVKMIVDVSPLHDIGKITIPDSILLKPGKLTPEEIEYMKSHTARGCEILNSIANIWEEDYRQTSYDICRYHHERYDGKGYLDGLKGEEIPIAAQIVSLADVYDALVSERVYKEAYSPAEAFHKIVTGECGIFSPRLLECFRKSLKLCWDRRNSVLQTAY